MIENIISNECADQLESVMLGNDFAWFYHSQTVSNENLFRIDNNTMDVPFFVHSFYNGRINSGRFKMVLPILTGLEEQVGIPFKDRLLRIKANFEYCNPNYPEGYYHTPHRDYDGDHEVLIYYVNNSDGDTLLFDDDFTIKKRVSPQKGKALLFDGSTFHAGTPPKQHINRMLINFVFKKD